MDIRDLSEIYIKCWEARNKWFNIGLTLSLTKDDLDAIKRTHRDNVEQCFIEMLDLWLKTSSSPTLAKLIQALKQRTVGLQHLAEKLERKFRKLKQRPIKFHQLAEGLEKMGLNDQLGTEPTTRPSTRMCQSCNAKLICPQCGKPNMAKIEKSKMNCDSVTIKIGVHLFLTTLLVGVYLTSAYVYVSYKQCVATGKGLEMAVVGENANAVLFIANLRGKAYTGELENVTCEVIQESTGEVLDCGSKKINEHQYEISYQPTSRGRHKLHIKVEGEQIKGSPFSVIAIRNFREPIANITTKDAVYSITVNRHGQIILATRSNITILDSSPNEKTEIISFNHTTDPEQSRVPRGLAVDSDDNILVADCKNNCIQKFSPNGSYIAHVDNHSVDFKCPCGVAVHPITNKIYVTNVGNHQIQVLNSNLTFYDAIGSWGKEEHQFISPEGLAFDSTGNLYVADDQNSRIQIFTVEGNVWQFNLLWPNAIAIDSDDIVYAYTNHWASWTITLFTTDGKFLTSFKREVKFPKNGYIYPKGITVDKNGIVYTINDLGEKLSVSIVSY